jgi:NAD(P)H-nitrite reductase large subunit
MSDQVSRCVCFNTSFSELLRLIRAKNLKTVDEVKINTKCGTKCELCVPYIKKIIDTHQIEFLS